jgi:hypothetical protein
VLAQLQKGLEPFWWERFGKYEASVCVPGIFRLTRGGELFLLKIFLERVKQLRDLLKLCYMAQNVNLFQS